MKIICQSLYYQYILDKFHFLRSPKTFRVIITIIYTGYLNYSKFMKTCIILACICNTDLHQELWDQEQV